MTDPEPKVSKILMVFAHADDETLLAGALIASLVSDGNNVTVLCLAPGDDDRTSRLHKACAVLGVDAVETLRYVEGAMWRDELDEASSASEELKLMPALSVVPVDDLASRVSGRISEINPNIVITHSVHDDYRHPDHAAVYEACSVRLRGRLRHVETVCAQLAAMDGEIQYSTDEAGWSKYQKNGT